MKPASEVAEEIMKMLWNQAHRDEIAQALTEFAEEHAFEREKAVMASFCRLETALVKVAETARAEALEEAAKHFEGLSYKKISLDMVVAKLRALKGKP